MSRITWTLAYRNPRANRFQRVTNWEGTWHQARELAGKLMEAQPALQVYYVQSAASEAREVEYLAEQVRTGSMDQHLANQYLEDHGNILVAETRRRVRMFQTGQLSAELLAQVPDADEAKARFEADAH